MFYHVAAYRQLPVASVPLIVSVPSGNFGNLTAGIFAKRIGLPVARFIASTNANDVVPEYLRTGEFRPRPAQQTYSNAMDVGSPNNFPRLLDLCRGTAGVCAARNLGPRRDRRRDSRGDEVAATSDSATLPIRTPPSAFSDGKRTSASIRSRRKDWCSQLLMPRNSQRLSNARLALRRRCRIDWRPISSGLSSRSPQPANTTTSSNSCSNTRQDHSALALCGNLEIAKRRISDSVVRKSELRNLNFCGACRGA